MFYSISYNFWVVDPEFCEYYSVAIFSSNSVFWLLILFSNKSNIFQVNLRAFKDFLLLFDRTVSVHRCSVKMIKFLNVLYVLNEWLDYI